MCVYVCVYISSFYTELYFHVVAFISGFYGMTNLVGVFNVKVSLTVKLFNYKNVSSEQFETGKHFILNFNINVLRSTVLIKFTIISNIIANRSM